LIFGGALVYKLLFKLIYLTSSVFQNLMLGGVVQSFGVFVTLPFELSPVTNFNHLIVRSRLTGMLLRDMAAKRLFFIKGCAAN